MPLPPRQGMPQCSIAPALQRPPACAEGLAAMPTTHVWFLSLVHGMQLSVHCSSVSPSYCKVQARSEVTSEKYVYT